MKKLKRLFVIVTSMLMILSGCSNATNNYDSITLKNAANVTAESGFDFVSNPFANDSRHFTVTKDSDSKFSVDVNGEKMIIQVPSEQSSSEYVPTNESVSKQIKIVSKSKKLVYQYIDTSTILKDKKDIKKYIENLNTKEADFTDDEGVGAYFSYADSCIYINRNNSEAICEWMIVHELIHAMSFYTHNCSIENEEYAFNLFNEILTDIITSSINPKMNRGILSGYSVYYNLLYPYINLFGENAIEAYFYGYNTIYTQIEKDEFEFFVIVIENYGVENSDVYYNNLIYKWYSL